MINCEHKRRHDVLFFSMGNHFFFNLTGNKYMLSVRYIPSLIVNIRSSVRVNDNILDVPNMWQNERLQLKITANSAE
jgi:galactose mutarotase-like enzyme